MCIRDRIWGVSQGHSWTSPGESSRSAKKWIVERSFNSLGERNDGGPRHVPFTGDGRGPSVRLAKSDAVWNVPRGVRDSQYGHAGAVDVRPAYPRSSPWQGNSFHPEISTRA